MPSLAPESDPLPLDGEVRATAVPVLLFFVLPLVELVLLVALAITVSQ
jgi:hypothetical protein